MSKMITFAEKVVEFNKNLDFSGVLPNGIRIMNPFRENPEILQVSRRFYEKFYNDNSPRKLILGINPGRFGAGVTGIPFTDTKRLAEVCKIPIESAVTHEPSSVFVYDLIDKYGGAEKFYSNYFITAMCPLGFVAGNSKGNWINCNYYDYKELFEVMQPFILESLKTQIAFGVDTKICYILGKKNAKFFHFLNRKEKMFDSVVVLEHPRYIQQYKMKFRDVYISDFLSKLT